MRSMSSRYDDSVHTNRVGGFTTFDLNMAYTWKAIWGKLDFGLSVLNVFDRKYIGQIYAGDLTTGDIGYHPGTPRTVIGKLSILF